MKKPNFSNRKLYVKSNGLVLERTNPIMPLLIGGVITFLLYYIHANYLPPIPEEQEILNFLNTTRVRLFERGFIPMSLLWVFFFGLVYLMQFYFRKIRPIKKSYQVDKDLIIEKDEDEFSEHIERMFGKTQHAQLLRQQLQKRRKDFEDQGRQVKSKERKSYYSNRFEKLYDKREQSDNIEPVRELKNELLDIDEEVIIIDLIPVKLCEWLLPLLGFLGTVIGVSESIRNMKNGVSEAFRQGRMTSTVLDYFNQGFLDLALAFDTTFLGLLFLIIVGAIHSILKGSITNRLNEARNIFTNIISKWEAWSRSPSEAALRKLVELNNTQLTSIAKLAEGISKQTVVSTRQKDIVYDSLPEIFSNTVAQQKFNRTILKVFEKIVEEAKGFEPIRDVLLGRLVEASELSSTIQNKITNRANKNGVLYKIESISASNHPLIVTSISDKKNKAKPYLQILNFEAETEGETDKIINIPNAGKEITFGVSGDNFIFMN